MPQNIAEFRVIGRVGKITSREKVNYVSVAANYNRRDGEDWKTDTHWNSIVCFSNVGQQVEAASKGDLVHITGSVRENNHGEGKGVSYRTELIADTFSILAKADSENGQSVRIAGAAFGTALSALRCDRTRKRFRPYRVTILAWRDAGPSKSAIPITTRSSVQGLDAAETRLTKNPHIA